MDYEKLYKTYYMQVYSYAVTLTRDSEKAEEITQGAFYKAISGKSVFRQEADELTWLCAIAKNLYVDELRGKRNVTDLSDIENMPSDRDLDGSIADADISFRIHLILHGLDEPYKEVFQLRVFGELSFAQIGRIFGKTENWARVTYHRAKLKIQERMEEKYE